MSGKKARAKMSASAAKRRAAKARVTRCQNECVKSGGDRAAKPRKKLSASKLRAAQARAQANLGPWRDHLAAYRASHPNMPYRDAQQAASVLWKAGKVLA